MDRRWHDCNASVSQEVSASTDNELTSRDEAIGPRARCFRPSLGQTGWYVHVVRPADVETCVVAVVVNLAADILDGFSVEPSRPLESPIESFFRRESSSLVRTDR
jgi:hypothetical protein